MWRTGTYVIAWLKVSSDIHNIQYLSYVTYRWNEGKKPNLALRQSQDAPNNYRHC